MELFEAFAGAGLQPAPSLFRRKKNRTGIKIKRFGRGCKPRPAQ